jgi:hypothetical protein
MFNGDRVSYGQIGSWLLTKSKPKLGRKEKGTKEGRKKGQKS